MMKHTFVVVFLLGCQVIILSIAFPLSWVKVIVYATWNVELIVHCMPVVTTPCATFTPPAGYSLTLAQNWE